MILMSLHMCTLPCLHCAGVVLIIFLCVIMIAVCSWAYSE